MALADAIFSRWDGLSERLPHRLEDLRGPHEGVVVLPVHLTWHGLREFDVSRVESRLVLYSILLGQGRRADLARFVSARRLAEDWPTLAALLSQRIRRACERRLGLLYARSDPYARLDPCANT
jgi:hypothetical protein